MTEMEALANKLVKSGIPFEIWRQEEFGGVPQLFYPSVERPRIDFICNRGSFGHEYGLLEARFLASYKDVEGWLSAEEAYALVSYDWEGKE